MTIEKNSEHPNFFDRLGLPPEHQSDACCQVAKIITAAADPKLARPYESQSVQNTGRKSALAIERELTAERRRAQALKSFDPDALKDAFASGDRISSLFHKLVADEIPAFNLTGSKIVSASDFALLMQSMRSPYFESSKIVCLNARYEVVSSRVLTVGALTESLVDSHGLFRAIQAASEKTKCKRFIFSHNHPSGDPTPSSADIAVTRRLEQMAKMAGMSMLDHIITNGRRCYSFTDCGFNDLPYGTKPASWEIIPRDELIAADGIRKTSDMIMKTLRQADPAHAHVVYLTTKLAICAVERIPADISPRDIQRLLPNSAAREGALHCMLEFPGIREQHQEQVAAAMKVRDTGVSISLLDAATSDVPSFRSLKLLEPTPQAVFRTPSARQRMQKLLRF